VFDRGIVRVAHDGVDPGAPARRAWRHGSIALTI